jgi:hypothetical protein
LVARSRLLTVTDGIAEIENSVTAARSPGVLFFSDVPPDKLPSGYSLVWAGVVDVAQTSNENFLKDGGMTTFRTKIPQNRLRLNRDGQLVIYFNRARVASILAAGFAATPARGTSP